MFLFCHTTCVSCNLKRMTVFYIERSISTSLQDLLKNNRPTTKTPGDHSKQRIKNSQKKKEKNERNTTNNRMISSNANTQKSNSIFFRTSLMLSKKVLQTHARTIHHYHLEMYSKQFYTVNNGFIANRRNHIFCCYQNCFSCYFRFVFHHCVQYRGCSACVCIR